jgi:hypothetical protein
VITVTINDHTFHVFNEWKDITIERASRVHAIKMPPTLRKCYEVALNHSISEDEAKRQHDEATKEISFEDQYKVIPKYFGEVLLELSDLPREMITKIDVISIRAIYHTYLKKIVEGIHFIPSDYQPNQINRFEFEGETYFLPTDKKVFGQSVPMVDLTALEFTESADLAIELAKINESKDLSRIANLISILCRKQGEAYDEDVCLRRGEAFKNLSMDLAWDVFFSLTAPLALLSQSMTTSFLTKEMGKYQRN